MSDSPTLTDLNHASAQELAAIPGINPDVASQIVQYRNQNGPFSDTLDILGVPGVTTQRYRKAEHYLTLTEPDDTVTDLAETEAAEIAEPLSTEAVAEPDAPPADALPEEDEEGYIIMWGDEEDDAVEEPTATADETVSETEAPLEETVETTPPPPAPTPVATEAAPQPTPEKQSIWRPWLLTIVGMFGGAVLALLVLQFLNGTLLTGEHPQITNLKQNVSTLQTQTDALNEQINDQQATLDQYAELNQSMQSNQAEILLLRQARDRLIKRADDVESRASNLETELSALVENAEAMQNLLNELEGDTERFNDFLAGLRELLAAAEESAPATASPEPAKTATVTPTPTSEPSIEATPTP